MRAPARAAFLQSFTDSFTHALADAPAGQARGHEAGPRPEAWLQELVRRYITAHDLPVDPRTLALCTTPWVGGASPPADVAARWAPALADADVDILGQAREALLETTQRHSRGAFYTPSDVATALTSLVLPGGPAAIAAARHDEVPAVLDPAVGGGAFLVAAAGRLEACGWSRRAIVERGLWGIDIDPLAVAVADAVLRCWAAGAGGAASDPRPVRPNLAVDDTLRHGPRVFPAAPAAGFDAVVGNPPFQNQLGTTTARARADTAELRPWLGTAAYRYADTATVFLAAALRLARPGGRVGLILPQSFLVADDAAGVRDEVVAGGVLEHLWVATEPVFPANVRVCAPVVRRRGGPGHASGSSADDPAGVRAPPAQRWRGRRFEAMGPAPREVGALGAGATWAPLVADLFGLPTVGLRHLERATAPLSTICTATAGFRDQYYGLVPHVREATEAELDTLLAPVSSGSPAIALAPLVTCGLIGPVWSDWGRRTTKFAKRTWEAPVVDLDTLAHDDPALHRWATARRVPKLVVATQTRVIEAVVDDDGRCYPSVPSIALACAPEHLWRAAAVVMSPVITLWAFERHVGAALSADALKVSARQLLAAPLPLDRPAWERAAGHLPVAHGCARRADVPGWRHALEQFAVDSAAAYRLAAADADTVVSWWLARLPTPTGSPGPDPAPTR